MSLPRSPRVLYATLAIATIAAGLACRSPMLGLAPFYAKYAGSILWGGMVYWLVAMLTPKSHPAVAAGLAALVAIGSEFSQLIQIGWLDQFRATRIGVLLLGRYFAWTDIAAYLVGIAPAAALDRLVLRRT
ncbi:DUF2809 domain-containing protein [Phreatobacter stygius]|uniref:DUF2809 domain-containing protein n=1 Tax=Phreatobacter stygius TaxID=1940610 RepID=A0A4D7AX47_9HYPH|nr:DUF2809 domain-containing protein [Phreatobacter stygius]